MNDCFFLTKKFKKGLTITAILDTMDPISFKMSGILCMFIVIIWCQLAGRICFITLPRITHQKDAASHPIKVWEKYAKKWKKPKTAPFLVVIRDRMEASW